MEGKINTNGQSTVHETPDVATINFSVTSKGDDQKGVAESMRSTSDELSDALESINVSTDLHTENYNITNVRNNRRNSEEELDHNYEGNHSYSLSVEDIDSVGSIIDLLVNNGVSQIRQVHFELSEDTYSRLRNRAIEEAVENARLEAEIAAEAEELSINGVSEITVERTHQNPVSRGGDVMMAMSVEDTSTEIKNDDASVTATVSIEYNLSE